MHGVVSILYDKFNLLARNTSRNVCAVMAGCPPACAHLTNYILRRKPKTTHILTFSNINTF